MNIVQAISKRHRALAHAIREGQGTTDGILALAFPVGDSQLAVGTLDAARTVDDSAYSAEFVISDQRYGPDRDGDVVEVAGVDFGPYGKNPVVLLAHNGIPIATSRRPDGSLAVSKRKGHIVATAFFDHGDSDSMFIWSKVKRGFLNAASLAFLPVAVQPLESRAKAWDEDEVARPRYHFLKVQATEWSIVPVPANAAALRLALDHERKFISPRLQKALLPFAARCHGQWCGWTPPTAKAANQADMEHGDVKLPKPNRKRPQRTIVETPADEVLERYGDHDDLPDESTVELLDRFRQPPGVYGPENRLPQKPKLSSKAKAELSRRMDRVEGLLTFAGWLERMEQRLASRLR
jgi:hypothetical protein